MLGQSRGGGGGSRHRYMNNTAVSTFVPQTTEKTTETDLSEPRRSPLGEEHTPLRSALAASARGLTQVLTNYNTGQQ
jgi:hypothetical protein